jgi:hypothetical protein
MARIVLSSPETLDAVTLLLLPPPVALPKTPTLDMLPIPKARDILCYRRGQSSRHQ